MVTNFATGVIEGIDDAVNVGQNAEIVNFGRIENIASAGDDPQDAIDLDSGTITNHSGGQILSTFDAAIDFDAGNGSQSVIVNDGEIRGTIAVEVELGLGSDPANVDNQKIVNNGILTGTSGIAAVLGAGDDIVELLAGSEVNGTLLFGADDDSLMLHGTGPLAGAYGDFDGGDDTDTVQFFDLALSDLIGASGTADDLMLTFAFDNNGTPDSFAYHFLDFELFAFGAGSSPAVYSAGAVLAAAAVPVPAAGLLLLAGLGGLAVARRRA